MKVRAFVAAFVALAVAPHVFACKPSQEWMQLSLDERMSRLFEKYAVVAHVRVTEVLPKTRPQPGAPPSPEFGLLGPGDAANVEVLESFKGPSDFGTIMSENTSCGVEFRVGQELVIFSSARRVLNSIALVRENQIPLALLKLRQLQKPK